MTRREKVLGQDATYSDAANAGRGGWVFPGLSPKMGGPNEKAGAKNVNDTSGGAEKTFNDAFLLWINSSKGEDHQKAYDMLTPLMKDPKTKDSMDPDRYKQMQGVYKRLEVDLNIS